jgi:hypothetical protein
MSFADDLTIMYADFGEAVTIDSVSKRVIFDRGWVDAGGLGVAGNDPSCRVASASAAAITNASTLVRGATTYKVRRIEPIPPDEAETRLILEEQ